MSEFVFTGWLSQHVSVSERLCQNHFQHPADNPNLRARLTRPGPSAVLSVSRVRTGCSAILGRMSCRYRQRVQRTPHHLVGIRCSSATPAEMTPGSG